MLSITYDLVHYVSVLMPGEAGTVTQCALAILSVQGTVRVEAKGFRDSSLMLNVTLYECSVCLSEYVCRNGYGLVTRPWSEICFFL